MPSLNGRAIVLVAGTLFATSACGGNTAVPTGATGTSPVFQAAPAAVDTTSILKKLTKDVVIGSTVDPKNGDKGPRAVVRVRSTFGLKAGQLLVCNFENSAGAAGKGSTIEVLDPKPKSKPSTFTQNTKINGCDGDAITEANQIYGTGMTSGSVGQFDQSCNLEKSYKSHIEAPFADADAFCGEPYAPEDIYVSDSKTGALVKFSFISVSGGKTTTTEVVSGFGKNGSGWSTLGPSGLQYNAMRTGSLCNDTLYVVDGVDNTLVSISNASNLLEKDEIAVQPGGKKFTCKHPTDTCATLVYSGSPLNAPVASALLPNGNLILANTKGGNTLVEITPNGKVLATKTVDTSKSAHVFGLAAYGTGDSDTVLYYTSTADNTLHVLEQ
ncbi:MAG: hypothetical protein ABI431_06285 [Candidatus Tumulicola sp.]